MGEEGGGEAPAVRFCHGWQARTDVAIGALLADHAVLRTLCDRLEALADGLPGLPPGGERYAAAEALTGLLPAHQRRESRLLDSLLPLAGRPAVARALLDRIRCQHVADRVHAQDLVAALEEAPGGGDADALGYMLRCFFDGCRRALAFEELAMLKLGRRRLSEASRDLLTASLGTGEGGG